ncbi:phosphomethylpyrimidine synthase ThiC [candidate division WOR-3 bacterium]|nr:phosphomethylpyrimidine synthase ThiC [candidate division WOR-3 bacterium]
MTELKKGRIPSLVQKIARAEKIQLDVLIKGILERRIVITRNKKRKKVKPTGIGYPLTTKINANVGTSTDKSDITFEVKKAILAEKAGADTIMDLSTGGDIRKIRQEILKKTTIPLGTVPIYQAAIEAVQKKGGIVHMTEKQIFEVIEEQAEDGVDFMTLHCGVTLETFKCLQSEGRVMDVVSRGGTLLLTWMLYNKKENPLYTNFDKILDIASDYDITLSLGDGFRPGAIEDSSDRAQFHELSILGELTKRAWMRDVQVIIEGPGHIPLNEIEMNVKMEKKICHGAPFYVLGPLVTDIAPGYDHIVSAIGGAVAAYYGADFLCYVTPSEHLGIPDLEDVEKGVIASRIAAHAGDIAKGIPGAKEWDKEISIARKKMDWERQFELVIDAEKAKSTRNKMTPKIKEVCSMCGEFCAIKLLTDALKKNK